MLGGPAKVIPLLLETVPTPKEFIDSTLGFLKMWKSIVPFVSPWAT